MGVRDNQPMAISLRTHKLLWGESHNMCAWCRKTLIEPAYSPAGRRPIDAQEAHIVARAPDGPRGRDIDRATIDVDGYENLVLLCRNHHAQIDDDPQYYTRIKVLEMKMAHIEWANARLSSSVSLSSIPPSNPTFFGCESVLSDMKHSLRNVRTPRLITLHGPGGVGKSQLAVEFAHRNMHHYDVVWWCPAADPTQIMEGFARLLREMGMDNIAATEEQIRETVFRKLEDAASWLLIFDDAESADVIASWTPSTPRDRTGRFHAIATTRRGGFDAIGLVAEVDIWQSADSVAYLETRVPTLTDEVAGALANRLGNLPLALEQSSSYLRTTGTGGLEYLELFDAREGEMLSRGVVAGSSLTIATLWDLSIERVAETNYAAVQIIDFCAYLAPVPVPEWVLRSNPNFVPSPLSGVVADALAYHQSIAALIDFALVRRTENQLSFHTLTLAAVRLRHFSNRSSDMDPGEAPAFQALNLLRQALPHFVLGERDEPGHWPELLPHVLTSAAHFDKEQTRTNDTRATLSRLLDDAASYLLSIGEYNLAVTLFDRALVIDQEIYSPDDARIGQRLNNYAIAVKNAGSPARALPLAKRALEITRATHGARHFNVARDLGTLANIKDDLGDYDEAIRLHEESIEIFVENFGPENRDVARRLHDMALVYLHKSDVSSADRIMSESVSMNGKAFDEGNPEFVMPLIHLAEIKRALGDLATSRMLYERAIASFMQRRPPFLSGIANGLLGVIPILDSLGDFSAALEARARLKDEFGFS
jgi:tetratricopeptide (TPR) repeat protein